MRKVANGRLDARGRLAFAKGGNMTFESIEYKLAQREIASYGSIAHELIIHESMQAQDCLDCEAFLAKGISALAWVERCEETLYKAHAAGLFDVIPDIESGLDRLYEMWLAPCADAHKWIAKCQKRGYDLSNLAEFQECCERAQERVERAERYKNSKSIRDERLSQEAW